MTPVSKSPASKKQKNLFSQIGFAACFAVFAAFFLSANVGVFAHAPATDSEFLDGTPIVLSGESAISNADAHHHPFEASPAHSDCEVIDETDRENEADDDDADFLVGHVPASVTFSLHSNNALFHQLELASHGRTVISLFVLHHSWRSSLI